MSRFLPTAPNQLLLNPRISDSEKKQMELMRSEFEKKFGAAGYFLVASSGSSNKQDESVKLIALSVAAVLNSARRFNSFFSSGAEDHWGLVLPEFHVAGLGVHARAFLSGASVFSSGWNVLDIKNWLEKNAIRFLSLVPAQVFDLAENKVRAPAAMKKVLVGGGALRPDLKERVVSLGWPVVETYGMTETASLIAVRGETRHFQALPGVETRLDGELLEIKCDSLLTAWVQVQNGSIVFNRRDTEWYRTNDRAEIAGGELKFLGRTGDFIKILGEGVSLPELKSKLEKLADPRFFEIIAVEDRRAGASLVLVCENSISPETADLLLRSHNQTCRPFEKISRVVTVEAFPRTELGKLKTEQLKSIIK